MRSTPKGLTFGVRLFMDKIAGTYLNMHIRTARNDNKRRLKADRGRNR